MEIRTKYPGVGGGGGNVIHYGLLLVLCISRHCGMWFDICSSWIMVYANTISSKMYQVIIDIKHNYLVIAGINRLCLMKHQMLSVK